MQRMQEGIDTKQCVSYELEEQCELSLMAAVQ